MRQYGGVLLLLLLPAATTAFFGCFVRPLHQGAISSSSPYSARRPQTAILATPAPVVEALAGKKKEYVVMEDSKGHSINTTMVAFLRHEGKRYCLGTPVDSPMVLLDSRGRPIDPSDDITERMFYQLDDYFTNKGYEILHTAGFLTIAGEPDWFDDDDDYEDDSDDEYDDDEEDSDDEDDDFVAPQQQQQQQQPRRSSEESVRVDPICDVEFEGSMYKIVQLLDRVPLSAEETPEGKWKLVADTDTHVSLDGATKQ